MHDREKVIKGLENCRKYGAIGGRNCNNHYEHTDHRGNCPYGRYIIGCVDELINDVLELLKSQRETIDELISADKALKLLEEQQEAVEPICQIIFDVPYYFCGSCKTMLNMYATKAKYCSQCGRSVKWND